jgi:hypothetical protein
MHWKCVLFVSSFVITFHVFMFWISWLVLLCYFAVNKMDLCLLCQHIHNDELN